jgi:hypothetical protein
LAYADEINIVGKNIKKTGLLDASKEVGESIENLSTC